jgi:hypothetical protein
MNMSEVDGMDMVEQQDHPANHHLGEEGMNMVDSNMVVVNGMDTVEVYFHPMNHRLGVEGMDMVDTGMGEDIAAEMELVEREPEGMVLVRHWSSEASTNSSGVRGACETRVFKRSNHVSQNSSCSSP